MRACNVDGDKLRRKLVADIESEREKFATDGSEDSKLNEGFHRAIQRAVIHAQSCGRQQVAGADAFVAILKRDV